MRCNRCNYSIPSRSKYCAYCGNQLQRSPITPISQVSAGGLTRVSKVASQGFPNFAKWIAGVGILGIILAIVIPLLHSTTSPSTHTSNPSQTAATAPQISYKLASLLASDTEYTNLKSIFTSWGFDFDSLFSTYSAQGIANGWNNFWIGSNTDQAKRAYFDRIENNWKPRVIPIASTMRPMQGDSQVTPLVVCNRFYLDKKKPVDPQVEKNLEKWLGENIGLKMTWIIFQEDLSMAITEHVAVQDYITVGNEIWAVGDRLGYGFIFHSPDMGNTWEVQWKSAPRCWPFIVYFSNQKEGWVGTKDGIVCSQNGGDTWEFRNVQGQGNYIDEYWFYNNGRIVAAYAYGGAYESTDGGKTWK